MLQSLVRKHVCQITFIVSVHFGHVLFICLLPQVCKPGEWEFLNYKCDKG